MNDDLYRRRLIEQREFFESVVIIVSIAMALIFFIAAVIIPQVPWWASWPAVLMSLTLSSWLMLRGYLRQKDEGDNNEN